MLTGALASVVVTIPSQVNAQDFVVYSVYRQLDMGIPGETPQKDYYLNMGKVNGLHEGSIVEVSRKVSTYDLISQKLYRDMTFPVGKLKVIHVENNSAVARLEKLLPDGAGPILSPNAVLIGDEIEISR